ncbi:MAG: glutathione peroxidase [Candidatus Heimdallarchaeota archaeon]|nr:glutathione peroxidase [Candidatus Heimdallarchaeota archaeon]
MTIYQYTMDTLGGDEKSLSEYKGKVLLIVNTASKCGFTPQYKGLQELYDTYNSQGLEILGFPCNQFFGQEPGTEEEIAEFCQLNYGVSFDMFAKIDVNGPNTHPLYQYLKESVDVGHHDLHNETAVKMMQFLAEKVPQNLEDKNIRWNFTKFLVNREGRVIKRFETYVKPDDIIPDLINLL